MRIKINLGQIYDFLRYVIISYMVFLIGFSLYEPVDDYNGELYFGMVFILSLLIIIRQFFNYQRFCGVSDMLFYYGDLCHITWRADIRNGLVEHIYYSFDNSFFEYELDYIRCGINRRCGYNHYTDFLSRVGNECRSYREYLTKNHSGDAYEDLKVSRYRHTFLVVIALCIMLLSLYNYFII